MRFGSLVAIVLLAGCPLDTGPSTGECATDGDCAGNVCARDGFCYAASQVREVKTTWTVRGQPATAVSCAAYTNALMIGFSGGTEKSFSYAPVPCENGQWLMDKLPTAFTVVELGKQDGYTDQKAIGPTGMVSFDLRY